MTPSNPSTSPFPPFVRPYYRDPLIVASADGVRIRDTNGREYLDGYAGVATLTLGHRPAGIDDAVRRQMESFGHLSWIYLQQGAIDYSRRLLAAAGSHLTRVFYVNSGSEAVDLALVLARQAGGTGPVIRLSHGYHGGSYLTSFATGVPGWQPAVAPPADFEFLPAPLCGTCPDAGTCDGHALPCLAGLRERLEQEARRDRRCILLAEPALGVGGIILPHQAWWQAISALQERFGFFLILDEVQTGFGRLGGTLFGFQHFNLSPDLVCLGKGIAGGWPLGALLMRETISESARDLLHFSTFGGHPVSLAAADAVLATLTPELLQNVTERGKEFILGLQDLARAYPDSIREVRGQGLFLGMRMKDHATAFALLEDSRREGLLIGIGGNERDVVRFQPALIFSAADVREALHCLKRALAG